MHALNSVIQIQCQKQLSYLQSRLGSALPALPSLLCPSPVQSAQLQDKAQQRQCHSPERSADPGGGALAAQVKETALEPHLLGILAQRLPNRAHLLLAVGQSGEGAGVEVFPVIADGGHAPLAGVVLLVVVHALAQLQHTVREVFVDVLTPRVHGLSALRQAQKH